MKTPAELDVATDAAELSPPISAVPHGRGRLVGIVTILTLFVAILGYVREATLAARFGLSATMDAYFGAIFIPTNIYLILVVGTVSPILIPILLHGNGDDRARTSECFSIVTNFVLILFSAVVVSGVLTARWWMHWLFPGFSVTTQAMALKLVYIVFPAVPLLALAGIVTATLNGFHKYSLAAFAPALSSLAVIASALLARGRWAVYIVGIGTTVGFLLQCLILLPAIRSLGIRYRFQLRIRHPVIKRLIQLGTPLILYLVVANGALVIERNLASRLSAGALSSLTYAMRLFAVPSNFLAAPLVIVAYPYFAREAMRPGYGNLRQELARTVRFMFFLFLPVTIWLVMNAVFVTRTLYERGQFGIQDSLLVSHVFKIYAIGILPNAITVPLLRCFYAIEDTLTPLWAESIDLVFFVVCAPLLTSRFGISGLVFVRAMTFIIVAAILATVLWRRGGLLQFSPGFWPFMVRSTLATAAMALVSWIGIREFQSLFSAGGLIARIAVLALQLAISSATFFATALLLKMHEADRLLRTVSSFFQRLPQNA